MTKASGSGMRVPSIGNPPPQKARARAAIVMPVLALPSSRAGKPLSSSRLLDSVVRQKPVVQLEYLSDSIFANKRSLQKCPIFAESITDAQLAAYDAWARREYKSILDGWRDHIHGTQVRRIRDGAMEWVSSEEWWYLVDVEEFAMDPRR